MKQNNIDYIKNNVVLLEISDMYRLIMIKYPDEFSEISAYNVAELLHLNGIRPYMFFDEKLDVDEIVRHIAKRNKIKNFCRKKEYHYEDYEIVNENTNNGQVINFNSYLNKRGRKVIRK